LSEGHLYIGLMSGTSLDGVDAILADFASPTPRVLASAHLPFSAELRDELLALQTSGENEIERAAIAGNALAIAYARSVDEVLRMSATAKPAVRAIGCHGQTIRHRPDLGFTSQIGNAALLAEKTGIAVVADFRSRDVAAGGQGAPLAPAFHAAIFSDARESRAILNLGGIANLTRLAPQSAVSGFDCGPGNCLMDSWCSSHTRASFDDAGAWASGGRVIARLLERMREEPYFDRSPPKSTGRDLFNDDWLRARLEPQQEPQDIQATLLELTAWSVADALRRFLPGTQRVIACGGGTRNAALMKRLGELARPAIVESSAAHRVDPQLVESMAFAWLAKQTLAGAGGNLPAVTGARGERVLGAIYPA
jgi:anhydro-N-acetylmuramic acid kinase